MKFIRPPFLYRQLFPNLIWKIPTREKKLYLTFDDGPIPGVTPWVLEELKKFNAKATFFCIGDNVQKNPEVYDSILQKGHTTGNHTFNHLDAWKTPAETYLANIEKAAALYHTNLFRPPYGKITFKVDKILRNKYKVVMWDILCYDFDQQTTPEECLLNITSRATEGSVIVFHDSLKAEKNMRYALTGTLKHFSEKGYTFESLPND